MAKGYFYIVAKNNANNTEIEDTFRGIEAVTDDLEYAHHLAVGECLDSESETMVYEVSPKSAFYPQLVRRFKFEDGQVYRAITKSDGTLVWRFEAGFCQNISEN